MPSGPQSAILFAIRMPASKRFLRIRSYRLHFSHPVCFFGAPVISGQDVAHGIPPAYFPWEPDGRPSSGKASMCILVLAEAGVG